MSIKGIFKNLSLKRFKKQTPDETYIKEKVEKIKEEDVEILLDNEDEINKKFSNIRGLSKFAESGKTMFSMIKDIKNGTYKSVPWYTIATVVVSLLYVLNPLDVIPDFLPGVGFIDDITVLTYAIGWIDSDLKKYLDWKIKQGND